MPSLQNSTISHIFKQSKVFFLPQLLKRLFCNSSIKYDFDLIVIGSGPAGRRCAVDASINGKNVAIIDKSNLFGGFCVHTGTIPSKTFRESVLHLTGYAHKEYYGTDFFPAGGTNKKISGRIQFNSILQRVDKVIKMEIQNLSHQNRVYNIKQVLGTASFLDAHSILVNHDSGGEVFLSARKFLIATGTKPVRPSFIPFDGERIMDSDDFLAGKMQDVPKHFIVIGAGVIGMEYASIVNVIPGCHSTIIDQKSEILPFVDKELTQTLKNIMRNEGARFLLNESVKKVERIGDRVCVELDSGKKISGDALLYAIGREPTTRSLNLNAAGDIQLSDRGLIQVNEHYQTQVPHIYAAGDVIGFPALASTSMEQGRQASCHMWDVPTIKKLAGFSYGIYTIPEMGMVGKTEEQLTRDCVPYEIGHALLDECAKGQMLGGSPGLLKLLFHSNTRKILGVHCFGENATEIVHIGQVAMDMDLSIDYFIQSVFNFPTFAEAYREAAENGLRRLKIHC